MFFNARKERFITMYKWGKFGIQDKHWGVI
nr:MAG TPA: hypothetical protein [Caudoviricetes sp.]